MHRSFEAVLVRVQAVFALTAIEVLLRTTTLPRTASVMGIDLDLQGRAGVFHNSPLPVWCGTRLRAVDDLFGIWPFSAVCLKRSLLQALLLRRLHPVLRLGWLPTDEGGNAHAWVEINGMSIDNNLQGIAPFALR